MLRLILLCFSSLIFFHSFSFAQEEMTLDLLLDKYREATASRSVLNRLKSMRIRGQMSSPSGNYDFVCLKKRPNLIKNIYSSKGRQASSGYNGEIAWSRPFGARIDQVIELDGAEKETLLRSAKIEFFLYDHEAEACSISYEGMAKTKLGEECYVVKAVFSEELIFFIYIHPETYAMAQQDEVVTVDGESQTTITVLSNYEIIDGVSFALKLESFVDGNKVNTVNITDVEQNIGVLSSSFNKPE